MEFETIEYVIEGTLAQITLSRPDCLNAVNLLMHKELSLALKSLRKEKDARCLILTGKGRGFCTGQDLEERRVPEGEEMPDLGVSLQKRYNPLILSLQKLEIPVICALNGPAVGAGVGIALACDIVLAARSSSLIVPFNRLGLIPDSGVSSTLARAIGHPRALAAVLLSEKITAQQAEDWGMVWKCIEDEDLVQQTREMALKLASQPPKGMALTKRAFNRSFSNTLEEQLDLESNLQRIAGRDPQYREKVMAFLNRG